MREKDQITRKFQPYYFHCQILKAKFRNPELKSSLRTSALERGTLCRQQKLDQWSAISRKRA